MTKAILECNGIAAGYVKGLNILQGVDLVVNQGEIVSIIGPNGAGKSTLLKAIMSLIKISAGRFFVNGDEKTNLSTHKIVMEGIGYVPEDRLSLGLIQPQPISGNLILPILKVSLKF